MKSIHSALVVVLLSIASPCVSANAAPVPFVINEANAVSSSKYLDKDGPYSEVPIGDRSLKQDLYFATLPELALPSDSPEDPTNYPAGTPDGRIQGNGDDWIELVVTTDHSNIVGWQIEWSESYDANDINPTAGRRGGRIIFEDHPVWQDLRAGTVITLSEEQGIWIDTDFTGNDRNFTQGIDATNGGDFQLDLSTDLSFNPAADDWWIHVSTEQEALTQNPLITTIETPSDYLPEEGEGFEPGDFSVTNDDWAVSILDAADTLIMGPISELYSGANAIDVDGYFGGGGVNSRELVKLQADPTGEVNDYVGQGNYADGETSTFGQENVWSSGADMQDFTELRSWFTGAEEGDYNNDGIVNLADYTVWRDSLGESGEDLDADGDGNGTVDANDYAYWKTRFGNGSTGGVAQVSQPASAPEPAAATLFVLGCIALTTRIARR